MITNGRVAVTGNGTAERFWSLALAGTYRSIALHAPSIQIDGADIPLSVDGFAPVGEPTRLSHGVTEHVWGGAVTNQPGLRVEVTLRVGDDSPVVRFRYRLRSEIQRHLTKQGGRDALTYFAVSLAASPAAKEVQVSQFNALLHSFCLAENDLEPRHFDAGISVMGPLLAGVGDGFAFLVAYEHGSQTPDAFLEYALSPNRTATLRAVKGNYLDRQTLDPDHPYETVWMEAGIVSGGETELAAAFRHFMLRDMSANRASREPFVFYNTWAYQERVFNGQNRPYLADMNETRMLAEIEVAHRMGIDVFVIDTGWYEKTGDWRVSTARFPHGLAPIKAKLDEYGMRLGLWFNPTVAAVSSEMRRRHEDCLMTRGGVPGEPAAVWETEASQGLCLVSRYGDAFADELIRLNRETGVTYFKWDAIGQYGCDAAGHGHGTDANTPAERRDAYAFALGAAMTRVVDKLCRACPDAIVDFDITEGGRTVGLQFLSAGKYFLINNGPYNHDYDMPVPADGNVNLFFYPGAARGWICRAPLVYDKWIPSVLFLTHYLPDDRYTKRDWKDSAATDAESQWVNLASLILGQNGIWGDLLAVSEEGVERIGAFLRRYKEVKGDITEATLLRTGAVGGSPEIYEKVAPSGRGAVSLFASGGTHTYVTAHPVADAVWHNEGVLVARIEGGRARITATFGLGERAKVLLFGVGE